MLFFLPLTESKLEGLWHIKCTDSARSLDFYPHTQTFPPNLITQHGEFIISFHWKRKKKVYVMAFMEKQIENDHDIRGMPYLKVRWFLDDHLSNDQIKARYKSMGGVSYRCVTMPSYQSKMQVYILGKFCAFDPVA